MSWRTPSALATINWTVRWTDDSKCSFPIRRRGAARWTGHTAGSTWAVREWIERVEPSLVISGHIHEGRGSESIGDIQVVNCGPAFEGYYEVVTLDGSLHVDLRRVPPECPPRVP